MKKSWLRKFGAFITSLSLGIGVAASVASPIKETSEVKAANEVTWKWTASTSNKLSTTAGSNTLAGKVGTTSVNVSGTTAVTGGAIQNTYDSSNYSGQQMGTGSANMTKFTLTIGSPWTSNTTYKTYTKIKSVSLAGACGKSTSYTVSATIDGVAASNTNKVSSLYVGTGGLNTCTFEPASGHETGTIVLTVEKSSGSKAWYLNSVTIVAEEAVAEKTPSSIALSDQKTTYYQGDAITMPTVKVTYSDSTAATVTDKATVEGFDTSTTGAHSATIKYTENNTTVSTTYSYSVIADTLDSISIDNASVVTGKVNQDWDLSGVIVKGSFASGTKTITGATITTTTAKPTSTGSYSVDVNASYGGKTASKTFNVTVAHTGTSADDAYTVSEAVALIEKETGKTNSVYTANQFYVTGKVKSDSTYNTTYSNYDKVILTDGTKELTVQRGVRDDKLTSTIPAGATVVAYGYGEYYNGCTLYPKSSVAPRFISITTKSLSSIAVTTQPTNKTYNVGASFNKAGMVVTATYSDGSTADVTNSCTISPSTMAANTTSVTVSYTEDSVTKNATITGIDVLTLSKITAEDYTTSFKAGQTFSFDGTVYPWYTHSNGSAESKGAALASGYTVDKSGTLSKGDNQKVTITYSGKTFDYYINVGYADVTSISMDSSKEVGPGGELIFSAEVLPEIANQNVTYSIDTANTTALESEYTLTGNTLTIADTVSAASVIVVKATTEGTNSSGQTLSTSCTVSVSATQIPQITDVNVTGTPTYTEQYVGKEFNAAGLSFSPVYDIECAEPVTITAADIEWNALVAGQAVTGVYEGGVNPITVTISGVTVVDDYLKSISISGDMSSKTYYSNKSWNFAGLSVTGVNASGDAATITQANVTYTADHTVAEYYEQGLTSIVVTASYGGKTATKTITGITVNEYKLNSLAVTTQPTKVEYIIGEDFSVSGLVVKATFSDGSTNTNFKDYELDTSAIDKYKAGTYTLYVKSGTVQTSFSVTYKVIVPQEAKLYYSKATSIKAGDIVTLYAPYVTQVLTSISTTSTKYGVGGEATLKDNQLNFATGVTAMDFVVVAGSSTGSFAFKNGDNYLRWYSGNSLDIIGTSIGNNTSWMISFDSSTGHATITNCTQDSGSDRVILWNYSNPRFACYKGQTPKDDTAGYGFVDIYKKTEQQAITAQPIRMQDVAFTGASTTYKVGDIINASQFSANILYNDGKTKAATGLTINGGSSVTLVAGDNVITVSNGSFSETYTVSAGSPTGLTDIAFNGSSDLKEGDVVTLSQFSAKLAYDNGASVATTLTSINGGNSVTLDSGSNVITVSNGTYSGTITLTARSLVKVTSITVSGSNETMYEGDTHQLSASVLPANADNKAVTWSSSDESIATVDQNGLVTAKKVTSDNQTVTITATAKDGSGVYGTITQRVDSNDVASIAIKDNSFTKTYDYGEDFDPTGLTIVVTYDKGNTEEVTYNGSNMTLSLSGAVGHGASVIATYEGKTSPAFNLVVNEVITGVEVNDVTLDTIYSDDTEATATVELLITYSDLSSTTKEVEVDIEDFSAGNHKAEFEYEGFDLDFDYSVVESVIESIAVNTAPKDEYIEGEAVDLSGLVLDVTMTSGKTHTVTYGASGVTITANQSKVAYGDTSLTVTYENKTASFDIDVSKKSPVSIEAGATKDSYAWGEDLDKSGFSGTITYDNGETADLSKVSFTVNGFDSSNEGTNKVTISYTENGVTVTSEEISLTIAAPKLTSITANEEPISIAYADGIDEVKALLEVYANYEDGTKVLVTDYEVAGFTAQQKGSQTLTISYGGKTDTVALTVEEPLLKGISVTPTSGIQVPYGSSYRGSVTVTGTYEDNSTKTITEYTDNFVPTNIGANEVTISYGGFDCTLSVTVLEAQVASIAVDGYVSGTPIEVPYGADLKGQITVIGTYQNSNTGELTDYVVTGYDSHIKTVQDVTITFGGSISTDIQVQVLDSTVITSLEITGYENNVAYGYAYSISDLTVKATYEDGIVDNNFSTGLELVGYTQYRTNVTDSNVQSIKVKLGDVVSEPVDLNVKFSEEVSSVSVKYNGGTSASVAYDSTLDKSLVTGTVTYTDGHTETFVADSFENYNSKLVGQAQTVTVKNVSGASATFSVTVLESTVVDTIEVVESQPLDILYDHELDLSAISLKVTYTDGHYVTGSLTELGATVSGYSKITLGVQNLTVSYASKTCGLSVDVEYTTIPSSIEVVGLGNIAYDGTLSLDDFTINVIYVDHTVTGVKATSVLENGAAINTKVVGDHTLVVSYKVNEELTLTKEVKTKVLPSEVTNGISIGDATLKEIAFENLSSYSTSNVVVYYTYTDGHVGTVALNDFTISGIDLAHSGSQTIEVSLGGYKASFTLTVKASTTISSLEVIDYDDNVEYGSDYDLSNVTIKATYTDGLYDENFEADGLTLVGYEKNRTDIIDENVQSLYVKLGDIESSSFSLHVNLSEVVTSSVYTYNGNTSVSVAYDSALNSALIKGELTFSDGHVENLETCTEIVASSYNSKLIGEAQSVSVKFGDVSGTITVTVLPSTVENGIVIDEATVKEVAFEDLGNYGENEIVVHYVYTDGHEGSEKVTGFEITGIDLTSSGKQTVIVKIGGFEASFELNVKRSQTIASFEVTSSTDIELEYGQSFGVNDIVITVTYTDGFKTIGQHPTSISGLGTVHTENPYEVVVALDGTTHTETIHVNVKLSSVVSSVNVTLNDGITYVLENDVFTSDMIKSIEIVYTDGHTSVGTFKEYSYIDNVVDEVVVSRTFTISVNETSVKASVTLNVMNQNTASIVISSEATTVVEGESLTFTSVISPEEFAGEVIYHVSDESVATVGENGVITFNKPGKVIVWATKDGIKSNEVTITVEKYVIHVTGIEVENSEVSLKVGEQSTINVTVSPEDATDARVTYVSADSSIAVVDSNGVISAVGEGETVITVTSVDGAFTKEIHVKVTGIHVSEVKLDQEDFTMVIGDFKQLTYVISPTELANAEVYFTSSAEDIALVDSNGVVYAIGEGEVTITVTSVDGEKTDSVKITVSKASAEENQGSEEKKESLLVRIFKAIVNFFKNLFKRKEE